ncbi:MAG TPA: lytic transglycosylase domain-containing protein, partial [Nitrospira sp.]|nr:lytic transglycosylase domain-containing protein [Nitrospira sp.]
MPKIDTYQARGSLQGAGNNPDMHPLNTAQGLADIGQGLGAVARASHEADLRAKVEFEKQQEYDAHLWSINQMTDFRNRMVAKMEDDKNYAQPGAEGFALAQNKAYEDLLGELRQQAPNTRAQQLFDVQARQFQDQFFSQALTFEAQEKQRFRVQTTVDYAKKESQALLLNPDLYISVVVPRLESINAMNVPPSVKDRLREDVSSHFSETVVRGVGNKNPGEALRRLDAGEFNKLPGFNLYGDKLDRLRSHLLAASNQIRSEATTQLRIALEDHLADYSVGKTTEPLPAGYNLTQVKDLLGPAGYKRYQDQVEIMSREKIIAREIRHGDLTSTVERLKTEQVSQKALVPYTETITKASRDTGVDAGVLAAQIMAESNGNPNARNDKTSTGQPSLGISQFQPDTAKQYGVDTTDPHSSIAGQARYMKDLLNQFGGDYSKALAAYNWGQGRVAKAVEKYGSDWMSNIPSETQAYVKKILSSSPNGVAGAKIAGATADMLQAEAKLRANDPAAAAERNAVELDPTNYPGQPITARVATRLGIQQNQFKLPEFQQRLLTKDEAQGYVKRIKD